METLRDSIPRKAFREIQRHLKKKSTRGEGGWKHAHRDEDTLTGDFLGSLRTDKHGDWNYVKGDDVRWAVRYDRIRGRGRNALEKIVGADALITIEVRDELGRVIFSKGILMQAKKVGNNSARQQVEKMENVAENGSFVITYSHQGYHAEAGTSVLDNRNETRRVGDFLSNDFLECKCGAIGLVYNDEEETILLEDKEKIQAGIPHRLNIDVELTK